MALRENETQMFELDDFENHRRELEKLGCYKYNRGLSYCYGLRPINCKGAALLFDRIYVDAHEYAMLSALKQIMFDESASVYLPFDPSLLVTELAPKQVVFVNDGLTHSTSLALFDGRGHISASLEKIEDFYSKEFVEDARSYGFTLMRVFQSSTPAKTEGKLGDAEAWSVVLERIPIIDTNMASWEQILEFRKDSNRAQKLRGIRKLHRKIASASSKSEAVDILENAIELYKSASTTHGFQLREGILEVLLDKQTILAAGIVGGLLGNLELTIGAGLVAAIGNVALKIKDSRYRKSHALLTEEGEAALIYDVIKKYDRPRRIC